MRFSIPIRKKKCSLEKRIMACYILIRWRITSNQAVIGRSDWTRAGHDFHGTDYRADQIDGSCMFEWTMTRIDCFLNLIIRAWNNLSTDLLERVRVDAKCADCGKESRHTFTIRGECSMGPRYKGRMKRLSSTSVTSDQLLPSLYTKEAWFWTSMTQRLQIFSWTRNVHTVE